MALFDGAAEGAAPLLQGLQNTADNFMRVDPMQGVDLQDPASMRAAALRYQESGDPEQAHKLNTQAQAVQAGQNANAAAERAARSDAEKQAVAIENDETLASQVTYLRDVVKNPDLADKLEAGVVSASDVKSWLVDHDAVEAAKKSTAAAQQHALASQKHSSSSWSAAADKLTAAGDNTAALQESRIEIAALPGINPIIKKQLLNPAITMTLPQVRMAMAEGIKDSEELAEEVSRNKSVTQAAKGYTAGLQSSSPALSAKYDKILSEGMRGQTPDYNVAFLSQQKLNVAAELRGGDPLWPTSTPINRDYAGQFFTNLEQISETGAIIPWFGVLPDSFNTPGDVAYSGGVTQMLADSIEAYSSAAGIGSGQAQVEMSDLFMAEFKKQAAALKADGNPPRPTLLNIQLEITKILNRKLAERGKF